MTHLPIRSLIPPRRPSFLLRHSLFVILLTLPLFLTFYGHGQAVDMMEMFNLIPVKEAFRDGHWLMPTLNGLPRLEKPPLPVWLPGSLAALVHSDSLYVTRLPSALMSLLTCFAVYWIGRLTSRDRFFPLAAALILATMLYFLRQGRLAGYDVYVTAFTTLGLAGLFGITDALPRYQIGYAILAGFSLGLALLSKGPVPPATVCLPFGLYILIYHRRRRTFLFLGLALIVCLAAALPWLIVISHKYPNAWATWKAEFFQYSSAEGEEFHANPFYYFLFFLWVGPWTPAFIAGLILPFYGRATLPAPTPEERRARWAFTLIIILGLILLSVPHEKKPRYALQLMPVAALAAAALWQQYTRLPLTQPLDRAAKFLLHAHTAVLAGAGLGILLAIPLAHGLHLPLLPPAWSQIPIPDNNAHQFFSVQGWRGLVAHWSHKSYESLVPLLSIVPTPLWLALGIFLLAAAVSFHRAQRDRLFMRAFFTALIAHYLLLLTVFTAYRGADYYQSNPYTQEVLAGLAPAGTRPIYTLSTFRPGLDLLYYVNHTLPSKTPAELTTLAQSSAEPLYILTRPTPDFVPLIAQIATDSGRTIAVVSIFNDEHYPLKLYKLSAP